MLIATCPEISDSGLRRTSQRTFRAPKTRHSEKSRAFILSEASFLSSVFGDLRAKNDPVGPGNGLIEEIRIAPSKAE